MEHKEQLPDKNEENQYGMLSIKVEFVGRTWLTGSCNFDAIAEMLLWMLRYGLASFKANPDAFVESSKLPLTRRYKVFEKGKYKSNRKAVEKSIQELDSGERTQKAISEFDEQFNFLLTYIANNLTNAINQTLASLIQEGLFTFEIMKHDSQKPMRDDPDDMINYLLSEHRQAIKKRLGFTRRQRKARYDLSELLNYYATVLPLWQDAKEIYKDNRKRNWQQIVKTVHPYLPVDLVARLSGNPSDLSDEVKENLAEKGGTSEPSDIAIEHAARLCGAPDYSYALSTLEGKKTELNRATKEL